MKRTKFTVELRNKLSSLACDLDSAACVETGSMTPKEREDIKNKIMKIVELIDKEIFV